MNAFLFFTRFLIAFVLGTTAAAGSYKVFAQTTQQYTTVASIAALKALTNRPQVVQITGTNAGVFNLNAGACAAADDLTQVQPTSGTTVCYVRAMSPYAVGATGSAVTVTATGSTTARSLADRFAVTKDPRDFGAVVNGSTDDTAAWNAALTAIQAAGGGSLIVPSGNSRVDGPINYTGDGLALSGHGYNSVITKTGTTGNWLNVTGNKITLEGFLLDPPNNASSGTLFALNTSGGNVMITDVAVDGGYDVLTLGSGSQFYASNITFNNFVRHGIRPGPLWGGLSTIINANINVDATVNTGTCIYLESGDTWLLSNINTMSCHDPIQFWPKSPSPGVSSGVLVNIFANNVLADGVNRTTGGPGWHLIGVESGAELRRIRITNSWAGVNIEDGFKIVGGDDISIVNSISINNGGHGIYLTGSPSPSNVSIANNTISGNSIITPNTYSGIYADDFISDLSIIGNLIKPTLGTANNQKYGVEISGSNHDRYFIGKNNLAGNATGALSDAGTGPTKSVFDNFGDTNSGTTGSGAVVLSSAPTVILPTSCSGLPTGALWNDSGTVKVCP